MKKLYSLLFVLFGAVGVWAQPTYFNNNTASPSNSFPWSTGAGKGTQSLFEANTFPGAYAGNITTCYWKVTPNITSTFTQLQVRISQTAQTDLDAGVLHNSSPFTVVYTSASVTLTSSPSGWVAVTLQNPYLYNPALSLIVEITQCSASPTGMSQANFTAGGTRRRTYTNHTACAPTYSGQDVNTAAFGFDLTPATACTAPPTAGTSTATPSGNICFNGSVNLNLSGNSLGTGQTYQWESSANIGGPYTPLSGSLNSPFFTTTVTASAYYQCAVTCSGNTQYSSPILVNVPALFPAGTYTINSALPTGGTNFQTFSAAVSAIACGIAGPVVFNVAPASGPYSEQVVMPAIGNTSATNTITINGNNETLTFLNTTAALPSVLELNGTDHVKVNNLNVISTAASGNGFAVHLWNNADNNRFSNCNISCNTTATATTISPFSVSGAQAAAVTVGASGSNDSLINCTVTGGYYTVVFTGPSTGIAPSGNFISGCTVNDSYLYSIYSAYNTGIVIDNNRVSQPTRTSFTTFYGIFITTNSINAKVTRNHVRNLFAALPTNTSTSYAIYINSAGTLGNENIIANNIVSHVQNNGAAYGIYALSSANHTHILHNTIVFENTSASGTTTTRGIWHAGTATTNVKVQNNIISITRGGTGAKHCLYYASAAGINSNNNVLRMNAAAGTNSIGFFGSDFPLLANWQTANASAWDAQSISVDPVFNNPTIPTYDFTPTQSSVNNIGTAAGISTDFNNNPRSLITPDPGAIEFSLSPIDMAVVAMTSPNNSGCYTSSELVTVTVQNAGTQTMDFSLTPLNLGVQVTGALTTNLTGSITTGTLAPNATTTFTFSSSLNMITYGLYTLRPFLNVSGDLNPVNDSLAPINRTSNLVPGNVTANILQLCVSGQPTMSVSGAFGGGIQWQSAPTILGPWSNVGSGTPSYLVTPAITQNTFYRVEVGCNGTTATTNTVEIVVNNPQIISTLPDSVCAPSTAFLQAAAAPGSVVRWFANQTGGSPLFVGSGFTTPVLNNNTTYWAEASAGGLGSVDSLGVPLASGTTTGVYHHMFRYTNITSKTLDAIGIKCNMAINTLTSWSVYYRPDNYQAVAGANTSSAGWTLLATVTNVPSAGAAAYTTILSNINLPMPANTNYSFYVAPVGSETHQYATSALGTTVATNTDGVLIAGNRGSSLFNCTTSGGMAVVNLRYSTGCTGTRVPVTAVVNPTPVITASPTNTTVCQTLSTTLSGAGAGAGGSYSWSGGIFDGVSFVPAASTVYTVTGTDVNGCSSTATASVTVNPIVSGTTSAVPDSICFGGSTTLTGTSIPQCFGNSQGFGGYYAPVNWTQTVSNSNGFVNFLGAPTQVIITSGNNASSNSGTTNYSITMPCPGTITFNWSYTNIGFAADDFPMYKINNGTALLFNGYSLIGAQTQTGTQSITVNAGDVLTLIANTVDNDPFACQITITNFSSPAPPVTGTASFWDAPTGGNNVGASPALVTPSTSGTLTYYAQFSTDVTGCVNPTRVPVTVTVAPQIPLSVSAANANLCTGDSTTLTATAPTATSIAWSAGTTPATGAIVSIIPPASNTYTATVSDASGCTTVSTVAITVNTTPLVGINASPLAPVIVCTQTQTVTLSATGASLYSWSGGINDGIPFTALSGTTTYTVTGTSGAGCSNTATISVTGNTNPTVTASSGTPIICNGNSSVLTGGGASTYAWTGGPATTTWSVSPTAYTVYTVTGTDGNGCTNTATTDVDVYSLPNITATGPLPLCEGASGTLSASATPFIISNGFDWQPGSLNGSSQSVTPSATTTYTVTGTDGNGCSNTSTVTVTVNTNPTVGINALPTLPTVCIQSQQVTLSGNGATSYSWSGSISNATAFTATSGTTTYTVTGTDGNGCTNTATIDVTGNDEPTVSALATPTSVCVGNTSDVTASGTATTYSWTGGPSTATWTVQPSSTTTYTVTGSTAAGCTQTATVSVAVNTVNNALPSTNSTNTNTQPDGLSVLYTNNNCDVITNINDGVGGNILGATTAEVNINGSIQTHNGQPYVNRWYQITPSNNGPATVSLYYTQADFNAYNTYATTNNWPTLPTGPLDATGIANMRITKVANGGLGNNPLVLTPTSVTWDTNGYWEVLVSTPSFSQFYAHAQNPNNVPLPAMVMDFSGYKHQGTHRLTWRTSSEYNNAYFSVEYSNDAQQFTELGRVGTQAIDGNSQEVLSYLYTHTTPRVGHNYYRLRQTDIDGKSSLEARVVDLIQTATGASVSIYPNPTTGVLQVSINEVQGSNVSLVVRDMSGRVVSTVAAQTTGGVNVVDVDLSHVAQGVYTLQYYSNGELLATERVRKL